MENSLLTFDVTFLHEIIFNWICTGIVAVVLHRLLYGPVTRFLRERNAKIKSNLDDAVMRLAEAEAVKADYESRLAEIERKKDEILSDAARRAAEKERLVIAAAKGEAKAIKAQARSDIEMELETAREEIKRQIIEISALMAGKLVSKTMNDALHAELLERALAELGEKELRI